jgi:nucleotide-binding universal stress UspA family protein
MFKVITVGTDGSETADQAVKAAADLARCVGAQLHVIVAFRRDRSGMGQASGSSLVDTGAGHALRTEAAAQVGARAIETWGAGVHAEHHEAEGDPVDVILDTSEAVGADLIVVGSKGMRGARRFIGSVPNSVAHAAACSVLVVKTV